MSAHPIASRIYPKVYFRRFTSLATAVVLHADTDNGGSAPDRVNHLPSKLIVEAGDVDDVLELTDVTGTTVAIVFPVAGTYILDDVAPVSIGGASTDVDAVTVFWDQGATRV